MTLGLDNGRVLLDARGSDQRYLLFEKGREDGPLFLTPENLKKLRAWAESATVVTVTGTVREHAGGAADLSAADVKPLRSLTLSIGGMSCDRCAARLTRLLRETDGVHRASVSFTTKRATVESVGKSLEPAALISVVEGAGFKATVERETTR